MNFKDYERNINDNAQEEYLKQWVEKQKIKKKKRKEKLEKIKEFLGGKR